MAHESSTEFTCPQAQELLSDLLDVRRGENPAQGTTVLADPATRARLEAHVDACAECTRALNDLTEVGAAYAEFSVGEKPAQDFADYATLIRERIVAEGGETRPLFPELKLVSPAPAPAPKRSPSWSAWLGMAATSAAAAAVMVSVLNWGPSSVEPRPIDNEPAVPMASNSNLNVPTEAIVPINPGRDSTVMPIGGMQLNMAEPKVPNVQLKAELSNPELQRLLGIDLGLLANEPEVDSPAGLTICRVYEGSPADAAGLRRGDRLTALNGFELGHTSDTEAKALLVGLMKVGEGNIAQLDYARPSSSAKGIWMLKRGYATLGKHNQ